MSDLLAPDEVRRAAEMDFYVFRNQLHGRGRDGQVWRYVPEPIEGLALLADPIVDKHIGEGWFALNLFVTTGSTTATVVEAALGP